jgi:GTP-dependent phosphoenolpyruvate carboxykinase
MGPPGSVLARYGVQITDHAYVAASLSLVARTGDDVLKHLGNGGTHHMVEISSCSQL